MPTILVFSISRTRRNTTGVVKAISHKLEDVKRLFLMSEGLRSLHGFHIDDENESCLCEQRFVVIGSWIMHGAVRAVRVRCARLPYTEPCITALELFLLLTTIIQQLWVDIFVFTVSLAQFFRKLPLGKWIIHRAPGPTTAKCVPTLDKKG